MNKLVLITAVALMSSCGTSAQYYENRVGDYQDVVCPIGYSAYNLPGVLPSTPNARRDMACMPDDAMRQTAPPSKLPPPGRNSSEEKTSQTTATSKPITQSVAQAAKPENRLGEGVEISMGGGSSTGLKGVPAVDFNNYFNQVKRRVESVWKFPDGVSGEQKAAVVFILDRDGNLLRADILESSDARLNASAIDAMKNASPFPPMRDGLKDLANKPLRMQFTVNFGTRR